jgi:hypothetical protein
MAAVVRKMMEMKVKIHIKPEETRDTSFAIRINVALRHSCISPWGIEELVLVYQLKCHCSMLLSKFLPYGHLPSLIYIYIYMYLPPLSFHFYLSCFFPFLFRETKQDKTRHSLPYLAELILGFEDEQWIRIRV